jgi:hypothetical protein
MFSETSRYARIPTATYVDADGRQIVYLRRRFLPPVAAAALLAEHLVKERDRLDNVTARYLDDPELFWLVCDANYVLAEIGRRIRIPLP